VGIFSLFGKKEPSSSASTEINSPSPKKRPEGHRIADPAEESLREQQARGQRQVARATALKIDAIESEMSSEFVRPLPKSKISRSAHAVGTQTSSSPRPQAISADDLPVHEGVVIDAKSTFMMGDTSFDAAVFEAVLEDVPLFEEAAVLFANGQTQMVETILQDAIEDDKLGPAILTAWAMLFDLYQIQGHQEQFEYLSIQYASRFETSPPAWVTPIYIEPAEAIAARAAVTPSVVFGGKLDATVVRSLEKARGLAEKNPVLRLEFSRITEVDPIGCGLLLRVLMKLQKSGIDLILVGAPELVTKVRAILAVGRRSETEAPWLLLLELLGLLNLESAFEEASIDYCITFEVSPPAFVAPKNKVTTAMDESPQESAISEERSDFYTLPPIIEGRTETLVAELATFVSTRNPARIDCCKLARIDANAAGQFVAGLMPVSGDGRVIEFINVNHLVAALFNTIGLKQFVRVITRKI
jgi:ABC-type transporter Mla MlaB component